MAYFGSKVQVYENYGVIPHSISRPANLQIPQQILIHPYWQQFGPAPPYLLSCIFIVLVMLSIVSILGNGLTIAVYTQNTDLNTPIRPYLLNLAVTDIIPSLTTNWMVMISAAEGHWNFGQNACTIHAFILTLTGFVSLITICAIALRRYKIMATKPTFGTRFNSQKNENVRIQLVLIWAYALALSIPPLFGWGSYCAEGYLISCGFDMITRTASNISYHIYCYTFGFFLPVFILLYCYTRIICAFKTVAQNQERDKNVDTLVQMEKSFVDENGSKEKSSVGIRQYISSKAEKMIVLVTLTYLAAWTPYAVIALIAMFGPPNTIGPEAVTLAAICAKSATAYNPIVYTIMDARFRRDLKILFGPVVSNPIDTLVGRTVSRQAEPRTIKRDRSSSYRALRNRQFQQEAQSLEALAAQGNIQDEITNLTSVQIRQMVKARMQNPSHRKDDEDIEIEEIFGSGAEVIFQNESAAPGSSD